MKKISLMLITLLTLILLFSVALAEENNSTEELDVTEDAELEEADETQISEEELADEGEETGTGIIKPYIRTLFFSGTGIAGNFDDPMDFYTVKVIGGKVALSNGNIIGRGILVLDNVKYRLVDLTINGDYAEAKIFSYTNEITSVSDEDTGTEIGKLSVTKVAKLGVDVWAGKMLLDSKSYSFYLITHKRLFKAEEIAEKARNYCKDHPYDEECKSVAGYLCKDDSKECRTKVYSYCEDHPTDSRCKEIIRSYCAGNLKDARCREELKQHCEENPDSDYCMHEVVDFCEENPSNEKCISVFKEYCRKHPAELRCRASEIAFCKNNPADEKCAPILKQYCEYNQKSELCGTVKIDYCKENPDALRCKATATALCILPEYKDTERCNTVITQAKERVRQAIATKANIGTVAR